ncbi:hypothetical protein GC173_10695 [bacterium]|nr:hypothetical protein [bacterium]
MRVLSIDLDFFLNDVKLWSGEGRLSDSEYCPWSEWAVRRFLEDGLGLSVARPVTGLYATHHDGAFRWWQQLIAEGRLTTPFEVVHVDAHADQGMGDDSFLEIMGMLTHLPVPERLGRITRLEEGNFLAYAGVCGWLSSLTYVTQPAWTGRDLHFMHFEDYEERTGVMEFKRVDLKRLERETERYNSYVRPFEPDIRFPFRSVPAAQVRERGTWDFAFFCQSPEYTPPAADALIPVIREYLSELP